MFDRFPMLRLCPLLIDRRSFPKIRRRFVLTD